MNRPTPALVTEAGARPIPRWVLITLCIAYLLPGQIQRDVWRHADLSSFGLMASLARGASSWLAPMVGGLPAVDGALLPYWLGALSIKLLPFLEAHLAARLPFVLMLGGVFALVWYATFQLARTEAAQPAPFAFGGEAAMVDYARTLADGALLALMATLGLLQLGHEATPDVVQLLGVSTWLYALACAPFRTWRSQWLVVASLVALALSGAPTVAQLLGLGGLLVCQFSSFGGARRLRVGLVVGMVLAAGLSWALGAWVWRLQLNQLQGVAMLKQLAWFTWPTLPLAMWTLWRWRAFLGSRHVSVPLALLAVALLATMALGGSDRALLLAVPALAVLSSFALPTLKRSWSAMVDWFSVFFFSLGALFVWAYYLAMQTDWLPRLASNLQRLAPDMAVRFDPLALVLGLGGTAAWLALVRWRTSRQRAALWRSLALPAGGVVLAWLLLMTLWLQPLNLGRSNGVLLKRLQVVIPADATCVALADKNRSLAATLEALGGWRVDAANPPQQSHCEWLVAVRNVGEATPSLPGWQVVQVLTRPTERQSRYWVLRREGQPSANLALAAL